MGLFDAQTAPNAIRAPLFAAVAMGGLHFVSAFGISTLRSMHLGDEEYVSSHVFDVKRRSQLNHAEYAGPLTALLLYLYLNAKQQGQISPVTVAASGVMGLGSLLFLTGFSVISEADLYKTNAVKLTGALMRYAAYPAILYSALQTGFQ